MSIGYIWPVIEDWGLKILFEKSPHYDYQYSIPRRLNIDDVLVFYWNKKLMSSIPVDSNTRPTTPQEAMSHPDWPQRSWKYVAGLDKSRKQVFPFPVEVQNIANDISILKGKKNLHAICRNAPKITMDEYRLILKKANKHQN